MAVEISQLEDLVNSISINPNPAAADEDMYKSARSFEDLGISPELLKGLYTEMRFSTPSKFQAEYLPKILSAPYKDLAAQAHNGTGKTTCFLLGMLNQVDVEVKAPQALCICPTRELATQNIQVLRKLGKHKGVTSLLAVSTEQSVQARHSPVLEQVIIGTPGTIKRLINRKKLSTRFFKILVFDEADHMLADDGFRDDSIGIIKQTEKSRDKDNPPQVLLFSATFNDSVRSFVSRVIKKDGYQCYLNKELLSLDSVKQFRVNCPDKLAKIDVVKTRIFELGNKVGQTIIFTNWRQSARALHTSLRQLGWECTTIHGAVNNDLRDKIIQEFKDGLTQVLITTDLLSRGFDQAQVNLVINFDLPLKYNANSNANADANAPPYSEPEPDYEVYLHRCGRAGRFGRKGAVFNLLTGDQDHRLMEKIQNHFNTPIVDVPNWNSDQDFQDALKAAALL